MIYFITAKSPRIGTEIVSEDCTCTSYLTIWSCQILNIFLQFWRKTLLLINRVFFIRSWNKQIMYSQKSDDVFVLLLSTDFPSPAELLLFDFLLTKRMYGIYEISFENVGVNSISRAEFYFRLIYLESCCLVRNTYQHSRFYSLNPVPNVKKWMQPMYCVQFSLSTV